MNRMSPRVCAPSPKGVGPKLQGSRSITSRANERVTWSEHEAQGPRDDQSDVHAPRSCMRGGASTVTLVELRIRATPIAPSVTAAPTSLSIAAHDSASTPTSG